MANWTKLAQQQFDSCKAVDELTDLVLPGGAEREAIVEMARSLGFEPPEEFVQLYSTHNGIGHKQSEVSSWWFRPLDQLPEFMKATRAWMEEHEDVGMRFFPFIDYYNGEGAGYFANSKGALQPGLFSLNTGRYEFDEDQESSEFLLFTSKTISSYILDGPVA